MQHLLLLADTAATAKGLEDRPWPFFLALVIGALGTIFGLWQTGARLAARRERDLYKQLHQQERERAQELKRERDDAREKTERVEREHKQDLVRISMAAEGLIRIQEQLKGGE